MFSWKVAGHKFKSTLQMVDPPQTLSFTSNIMWLKCIHIWKLEKTDEEQTIASVEESLNGVFLPWIINHHRTHTSLLKWLSSLKEKLES